MLRHGRRNTPSNPEEKWLVNESENSKRSASISEAFSFERAGEVPEVDMAVHGNAATGGRASGVAGTDRRDRLAENRGSNVRGDGPRPSIAQLVVPTSCAAVF